MQVLPVFSNFELEFGTYSEEVLFYTGIFSIYVFLKHFPDIL